MLCIISSNRTADSDDAAAVVKITVTLSSSDFHCFPQLQGRISGDAEWKAQRGEDGKSLADLEASTDSMCGVEIINETADSDGGEGDRESNVILRYCPLGGSTHRDTADFDSAQCLWRMVESLSLCVSTAVVPVCTPLPLSAPFSSSAVISLGARTVDTTPSLDSTVSAPPLSLPLPKDESLFDMLNNATAKATAENLHGHKKSSRAGLDSLCRKFPLRKHKKVTCTDASIWQALRVSRILIFAGKNLIYSYISFAVLPIFYITKFTIDDRTILCQWTKCRIFGILIHIP